MITPRAIAAGLAVAILAGACAAPAAVATPTPGGSTRTVAIELGEWSIKASETAFRVGVPYRFTVRNTGKVVHEAMLMPVQMPGMSMGAMDRMALGMAEDIPPGGSASFDVTFAKPYAAGEIELACHLPGHYEAGMRLGVTVDPAGR